MACWAYSSRSTWWRSGKTAGDRRPVRRDDGRGYTPNAGIPDLREAIATKLKSRNKIDAAGDQVIVTPGAIAALHGTMLALCNSGDETLLSDPAWLNYRMLQGAVTSGSAFGPASDQFVRASLASNPSELRKGVERLVASVAAWSG